MPSIDTTLSAHGDEYEARLTVPENPDGRGVAMVPGAGHGPWGDIFDRFAETAAAEGIHVLRYDGWPSTDDLDGKTLNVLHAELDAALDRLRDEGCESLAVVAKSFGGGVTLTRVPDALDVAVFWAPATFYSGERDGVADAFDVPMAELIEDEARRRFAPSRVADVDARVRVIVGTDDEALPTARARRLVDALPNADLVRRDGEDHSFRGEDREAEIVDQTLAVL
jgi:predicted alpha/beta hydrolase